MEIFLFDIPTRLNPQNVAKVMDSLSQFTILIIETRRGLIDIGRALPREIPWGWYLSASG